MTPMKAREEWNWAEGPLAEGAQGSEVTLNHSLTLSWLTETLYASPTHPSWPPVSLYSALSAIFHAPDTFLVLWCLALCGRQTL